MTKKKSKGDVWQSDREGLRRVLDIPALIEVSLQNCRVLREFNLWEYPHIQRLIEYTNPWLEPVMQRQMYEIDYHATYRLGKRECSLTGNTYLLLPAQLDQVETPAVMETHCTGSVQGIDEFFSKEYFQDPDTLFNNSVEGMSVMFHSYYLQLPIQITCKWGPGVKREFTDEAGQDEIGRDYTICACEKRAAQLALEKLGIPVSKDRCFVGGISRGGFRALLLSAFDDTVTHLFSVAGLLQFREWAGLKGKTKEYSSISDRPDLLEQGVETHHIYALIKAKTLSLFAWADGNVSPHYFTTLRETNRIRQGRYGLPPIELKVFKPEPGRRGHAWPQSEAVTFFANAMWE